MQRGKISKTHTCSSKLLLRTLKSHRNMFFGEQNCHFVFVVSFTIADLLAKNIFEHQVERIFMHENFSSKFGRSCGNIRRLGSTISWRYECSKSILIIKLMTWLRPGCTDHTLASYHPWTVCTRVSGRVSFQIMCQISHIQSKSCLGWYVFFFFFGFISRHTFSDDCHWHRLVVSHFSCSIKLVAIPWKIRLVAVWKIWSGNYLFLFPFLFCFSAACNNMCWFLRAAWPLQLTQLFQRACCYNCLQEWERAIEDLSLILYYQPGETKVMCFRWLHRFCRMSLCFGLQG